MNIDFTKGNGLVPVVIQDNNTLQVLMVGYMNEEAFKKTKKRKKVTFSAGVKTVSGPKERPQEIIYMLKKYYPIAIMTQFLSKLILQDLFAIQEVLPVLVMRLQKDLFMNWNRL